MNDESEVSLLLMIRVWSPRLTEREIPRTSHQLVKNVKSFYQIKHVGLRTDKVVSALSRASLYRDEARRGVSVAAVPLACWEPTAAKTKSYPWQPTLAESQWSAGCERCRAVTWQTLLLHLFLTVCHCWDNRFDSFCMVGTLVRLIDQHFDLNTRALRNQSLLVRQVIKLRANFQQKLFCS